MANWSPIGHLYFPRGEKRELVLTTYLRHSDSEGARAQEKVSCVEPGDQVMPFLCKVSGMVAVIFLVIIPVCPDGKSVKAVTLEVDSLEQVLLVPYHSPNPHLSSVSLSALDRDL